jgi:hypothetical protein
MNISKKITNKTSSIMNNPLNILLILIILSIIVYFIYKAGNFSDPTTYIKNMANLSRMSQSAPIGPLPLPLPAEVYNIADQKYNYQQAKCKCASYGSRLATVDEVNKAYNNGAEWCKYGWTEGGYVIFPTQESTYNTLKQKINNERVYNGQRPLVNPYTKCGRPGLNGGLADKKSKFGVNCFGMKPPGAVVTPTSPTPPPLIDPCTLEENAEEVENTDKILPFDDDKWSYFN